MNVIVSTLVHIDYASVAPSSHSPDFQPLLRPCLDTGADGATAVRRWEALEINGVEQGQYS